MHISLEDYNQYYEMPNVKVLELEISKVENQKRRIDIKKEDLIRLTPENVRLYIGQEILFRTRGDFIFKEIKSVSKTGKTIYIDHPDLQNALQIVSRKVYVVKRLIS